MATFSNFTGRTKHSSGFTLVELMIAVVIIAIISAIAYPSYQKQVQRARLAAAQAHLMDIAQRQQEYLLNARTYAASVDALSMTTPPDVASFYTIGITISSTPPMSFSVSATPKGDLARSGAVTLTLDGTGVRAPAGVW